MIAPARKQRSAVTSSRPLAKVKAAVRDVQDTSHGMVRSMKEILRLQIELLAHDMAEVRSRLVTPTVLAVIAAVLGIAGTCVALLGAGQGLAAALVGEPWHWLLGLGVVACATSFGLLLYVAKRLATVAEPLQRSQSELQQNLHAAEIAFNRLFGSRN